MYRRVAPYLLLALTTTFAAAQDTAPPPPPEAAQSPQQSTPDQTSVTPMDKTPVYRVNVVSRSTNAVNYQHRSGTTKVDMRGTSIQPQITGSASVDSKQGRIAIDATLDHMKPASFFGPEYLTYVLWAITPEGRPVNLGELIPNNDGKVSIRVTSDLQAFGLIVTAEPYFSVTRPSDIVVAENQVRHDTKGWEQPITAHFDALERGEYTVDVPASQLPATSADRKHIPLELLEAQNAVAIAKATGAEQYAPASLARAQTDLDRANDYLRRKQSRQAIGTMARGAAQAAEDARVLTIRRKNQERIEAERRQQLQQTQEAQARAQSEAQRAEQARQEAENAAREKAEAEQARQQAEQERQQAEVAKQQAVAEQQRLAAQAQQAQAQAQQSEQMRSRLLQQLNSVLQTRDTARGLIVNMNDVLFDFGKATLRPGARLRLAKVAGIIQAYPDLKLQVEGHTDSVGSDQYNQELSERRAAAVRDFLVQEGVPLNNVSAQGYGKKDPVATNETAEGRQANRRVDLVVSGQAIGQATTPEGPATSNPRSMAAPANSAPANNGAVQQNNSAPQSNPEPQRTPTQDNDSQQLQPVPPANDNTPR
ncbi:MAG TPA: OmpA family protein [Candidatus Acidoferrales bacterium]|nr:OmpA family protein [Candidatus Acidoferrales bacterium]